MKTTLCVDVGGTRVKAAIVAKSPSLEQMQQAPQVVIRTLGWLNKSLPELFNPENWASLASYFKRIEKNYDSISVCVPGPVDEDGRFYRSDLTVPKELKACIKEVSHKPVHLLKDADAWMAGFVRYMNLIQDTFEYPALLLAFGTGVGMSLATGPNSLHSVEIGKFPTAWREVRVVSKHAMDKGWYIHHVLGKHFFDWVNSQQRDWDYGRVRNEFTSRVAAAINDSMPALQQRIGKIRTIVVAGGNAEFVSVSGLGRALKLRIIDLTDRHAQLKPDLISLLGVEASSRMMHPRTVSWQ